MGAPSPLTPPFRFGVFEFDPQAGELRKQGIKIRLQGQPVEILALLLSRPGEVVTREEFQKKLWPADTFVSFEQSLNAAMTRLRAALGDPAETPRFVETLVGRGYRFIAPVEGGLGPGPAQSPQARRLPWVTIAAFFAGLLAGGVALSILRPTSKPGLPLRKFVIRPPVPIAARTFSPAAAISPDGKRIAFVSGESKSSLWIQDLDQSAARRVASTEGARTPFWSPDSKFVGFVLDNELSKAPAMGGHPSRICELPVTYDHSYGGTWSPDGQRIVVAVGSPSSLYVAPSAGGAPKPLLSEQAIANAVNSTPERTKGYFHSPHFIAGSGSLLAYSLGYLNPSLVLQNLVSGRADSLGRGGSPFYAASGYLLSMRPGTNGLWAQRMQPDGAGGSAEAFRIAANGMHPSVSNDGTLVYLDSPLEQLVWVDRSGKRTGLAGEPKQGMFYPAISPDGRFVAVEILENANLDIWIYDMERGSRVRLTDDLATDLIPSWSPAGGEVAFSSYRSGSIDIWLRRADGGAAERLLLGTGQSERVSDWSKDGRYILYSSPDRKGQYDVWYLARGKEGNWQSHPYLQSTANEMAAKLSPDGRFVAYLSDESGRLELYVRDFPRGERKWAISSNGATQPRWSRDGKELFYAENGTLLAVPVRTVPDFVPGAAIRLFASPALARLEREPHYDVSADRQRILIPETVGGNEILIHVVQNWLSEYPGGGLGR